MDSGSEADIANTQAQGAQNIQQLSKKLVRYALACEYARQPIRRADISQKVLDGQGRQFKAVFAEAQLTLSDTFGMKLVELPPNENVTLLQRKKAAQKSQSQTSPPTRSWRLVTTLPDQYRVPTIMNPSMAPSSSAEAEYVGLYTFIVALIALNDGTLPQQRLDRQLRRTNTEHYTPVDKTDRLLARMQRDGYLVKVTQKDNSGEESIEWMVGPRGKTEVTSESITKLVLSLYGHDAPDDLEARIERSLNSMDKDAAIAETSAQEASRRPANQAKRKRGRPSRSQAQSDEADEASDDESNSDDD